MRISKQYFFEGANGRADLSGLFEGRRRLIVYHFPFDPAWDVCGPCSNLADRFATGVVDLPARDTSFTAVSRAPIAAIESCRTRLGWTFPWLSSLGNTFHEDFRVTRDDVPDDDEERPGLSVFLRAGARIYHALSTYQLRPEALLGTEDSLAVMPPRRLERLPPQPARR